MTNNLYIYNTLSRSKELFVPILAPKVGMYVCGPTLYNEPHMGNLRTFISFDMVYRYLSYLGYEVKYVRNITDAGHITNSLGKEVDEIGKAAKMAQVQPLEIVYKFNLKFAHIQKVFNLLPPTIEPTATAHIQEQIEIIEKIIENGLAYESNGAVYLDIKEYISRFSYGILSGRNIEELESETRELQGQEDKKYFADFGLWKKANPEDMQIWRSPWGDGNPGWHIECTAMSTKYLGNQFDIHGGGMDLKAVHHENEIAQSCSAVGISPANYWMHTNMLNLNGKKMSKSLGNYFLPLEIIEGTTSVFSKPYKPMVVRFLMMMGHYRSELDFSDEALLAAEKGFERLTQSFLNISKIIEHEENISIYNELEKIEKGCRDAMNDDFNTSICLSHLFELSSIANKAINGEIEISKSEKEYIDKIATDYLQTVMGIEYKQSTSNNLDMEGIMNLVIGLRKQARDNKDFATSDLIREELTKIGIELKDGKDGTTFVIK